VIDGNVRAMAGEAAERYYSRRVRRLAELRARQEEWDFLARRLDDGEVAGNVGPGRHGIVLELHDHLLAVDPRYRLISVTEELGGLFVSARFAPSEQPRAARLIQAARSDALTTSEVCGQPGRLRPERLQMKTLCHDYWRSDRAAAEIRGERYADAALSQLVSSDGDHPSPEEILAWLDEIDTGT
jgi:hypothetical protein